MSIDKILEYQNIDREFYKLERQVSESEEAKKRKQYIDARNKTVEELAIINSLVEELFMLQERLDERFKNISKEIVELSQSVQEEQDEKQLDFYAKSLESHESALDSIEKESIRIRSEFTAHQKSIEEKNDLERKYHSAALKYNDAYNKLKETLMSKVKELANAMKEMEPNIDKEILSVYHNARKNKKMPVFVPFESNSCGGCSMGLAVDFVDKLKSGKGYKECPNCGRIVYIKNEKA